MAEIGIRFVFGGGRYVATEFRTRFGTVEWHVHDTHTADPVTGLPALIRQFDTAAELDMFIFSTRRHQDGTL